MSSSDQILGQNSQDVFAKPFLQEASLLNSVASLGIQSNQPNNSLAAPTPTLTPITPAPADVIIGKNMTPDWFLPPLASQTAATVPIGNSNTIDPLTGNRSSATLATTTTPTPLPTFSIIAEGRVTVNGNSDFDGVANDLTDDVFIYAGNGFNLNGNTDLATQRDASGNIIVDSQGRSVLRPYAVSVGPNAGSSSVNGLNRYAGLIPPPVAPRQTVAVPVYADLRQQELDRRIPTGTTTVTFDAKQNSLKNAQDWNRLFPTSGTATQPRVVRVVNGSLNIPNNVIFSNMVIIVENGNITMGNNQSLDNVALVANAGTIDLSNIQAKNLAAFASGGISTNGGARFDGTTLLVNNSGDITFNSATKTFDATQNLRVISQGNILYNGATNTRGNFVAAQSFTFNGTSSLYGSIQAKGDITFNGRSSVVAIDQIAPTITARLERDTAPSGTTNTDRLTFDATIVGQVTDNIAIAQFKAGIDAMSSANFVNILPQRQADGTFRLTRSQLEQINGGTLVDGVHTLKLQAIDQAGNASAIFELTFTLDTKAPTISSPDLITASDSGRSNTDNLTNTSRPTLEGTAEAGAIVRLYQNNQLIGQAISTETGAWAFQVAPLADGQYSFTTTAEDAAGNVSLPSAPLLVTIDTKVDAPINLDLIPPSDSGQSDRDDITNQTSPIIAGQAETGTIVKLYRETVLIGETTTDANGRWQVATTALSNGTHRLTATATDAAGNVSSPSSPLTIVVDAVQPTLSLTTSTTTPITQVSKLTGSLDGTGSAIASATYFFDGGVERSIVLDAAGRFDQAFDLTGIANGNRILTIITTDVAGNVRTTQLNVVVAVDKEAPIITAKLVRDTAPDNQTNQDVITFDPTIFGTVRDANPIVEFQARFSNTAPWVNILAQRQADGSFTLTRSQLNLIYGAAVPDGTYTLQLQAKDEFGNVSLFGLGFTLDTIVEAPQNLQLTASSDTGTSGSDRITRIATPTITGRAEPNARVQLFEGTTLVGQTTATEQGTWQMTTIALSNGVHTLSAIATDIAGNVSVPSQAFVVTVDAVLPTLILNQAIDVAPLTDGARLSGIINGTGSAIAQILYRWTNGQPVSINADADGAFDQELDFAGIGNGLQTLTIVAVDVAGNISTQTFNVTVALDTDAPLGTATLLNDTAMGGTTNTDRITSDPTITGTVLDANQIVAFRASVNDANPTVNVLAAVDAQGRFMLDRARLEQILGSTLSDGTQTVYLQAVDQYNNVSQIFEVSFVLDTSLALSVTLDPAFDSAPVGDSQTISSVVSLSGQVEAGAIVKLVQTGATAIADVNGRFVFENVALALGDNAFTFEAEDIAGNRATTPLIVKRLGSNQAPTDILLSSNTIPENSAAGVLVGTLSTIDPDAGDQHQYTLVDNSNGRFQLIGNELRVAPGAILDYEAATSYTVKVRTTDNGKPNLFFDKVLTIRLSDINERPVFTSTPIINAEAGKLYSYTITTVDPENGDRVIAAKNLPSWLTLTDNGNGTATLTGTPSSNQTGLYAVNLTVTDAGGLTSTQIYLLGVDVVLREGTNFRTSQSVSFTVDRPTLLKFTIDPSFDTTQDFVNDAFEVALVDAKGRSLVPAMAVDREVFFNWTEGESVALGSGATYDSVTKTVILNLTGVPKNTEATLVFRLINNDQDTATEIRIRDLQLIDAPANTLPPVIGYSGATNLLSPVLPNFNVMEDVSSSMAIQYDQTSFDSAKKLLYTTIAVKNNGTYSVDVPLLVAVSRLSDPSVLVRNPDGYTPEGLPYYDFSHLVADGKFDPSELSGDRSLVFYNPNGVQFIYELVVLAQLNRAPKITSQPVAEVVAGNPYTYQIKATDPNQDVLIYSLKVAPDGMTINSQTGVITWATTASSVGNQSVMVEVSDGRGGKTTQVYTLSVLQFPSNRPPQFTSTPTVDAYVGQNYQYDAQAKDPDQDNPLIYSLVSGPDGMSIDALTGRISWKPPAALVLGDTVLSTINAAGQIDEFTFTGVAGQRLYIDPLRFSGNASDWQIEVYSPSNRRVLSVTTLAENQLLALTEAGNYRVRVSQRYGNTGSYGFSIIDIVQTPVLVPEKVVQGKLTPGSEDDLFRFTGRKGQRVFIDKLTNNGSLDWVLYNSNNQYITYSGFSDLEMILPADGEYLLALRGQAGFSAVVDYSFMLVMPDIVSRPMATGALVTSEIAKKGEQDIYTFEGKAGQQLYLDAISGSSMQVSILDPFGRQLTSKYFPTDLSPDQDLVLGMDGLYQVVVDGYLEGIGAYQFRLLDRSQAEEIQTDTDIRGTFDRTGTEVKSYRFSLSDRQYTFFDGLGGSGGWTLFNASGRPVATGRTDNIRELYLESGDYWLIIQGEGSGQFNYGLRVITPEIAPPQSIQLGETVKGAILEKGEQDNYTFVGQAGQQLFFDVPQSNPVTVTIYDPAGRGIFVRYSSDSPSPIVLNTSGTYRVEVDGYERATGNYTFRLLNKAAAIPISFDQTTVQNFESAGLQDSYRFTISERQYVFLDGVAGVGSWQLYGPSGNRIDGRELLTNWEGYLEPGEYWLLTQGNSNSSLGYQFQLITPEFAPAQPKLWQDTITGTISKKGERDAYTFQGTVGQQLFLDVLQFNATIFVEIFDPMDRSLGQFSLNHDQGLSYNSQGLSFSALPLSGTYRVVVDGEGEGVGNYSFRFLQRQDATLVNINSSIPGSFDATASPNAYRFTLDSNRKILIQRESGEGVWELYSPNGRRLTTQSLSSSTMQDLVAGEYWIIVQKSGSTSNYTFRIQDLGDGTVATPSGSRVTFGTPVNGSITSSTPVQTFRFDGTVGQQICLDMIEGTPRQRIAIFDPAGQKIYEAETVNDYGGVVSTLTLSGTYQVVVDNSIGTYSFRLLDKASAEAVALDVEISGTFNNTSDSRLAKSYRFNLAERQYVFFDGQSTSNAGYWRLYDSAGRRINESYLSGDKEFFLDAGSYWLVLQGAPSQPFDYRFKLITPALPAASSFNLGATVSGALVEKGSYDTYSFSGLAGQQIFVDFVEGNNTSIKIYDPAGQIVYEGLGVSDSNSSPPYASSYYNNLVLTQSGIYKVIIDGQNEMTGQYAFRLLNKADAPLVSLDTDIVGQLDSTGRSVRTHRFTLIQGQSLFFDGQGGNGQWWLYGSSGEYVTWDYLSSNRELYLGAGDYWLVMQGLGSSPFDYRLRIITPEIVTAPIFRLGDSVTGTIAEKGSYNTHSFNGTAGQQIFVDILESKVNSTIKIYDPTGELVYDGVGNADFGPDYRRSNYGESHSNYGLVLKQNGLYKIVVDGNDESIGNYVFRLLNRADAFPISLNTIIEGDFDVTGQQAKSYRFSLTNQQYLFLDRLQGTGSWTIYGSNGAKVKFGSFPNDAEFDLSAGDYWLVMQGTSSSDTHYRFSLITPEGATSHITLGQTVNGTLSEKGSRNTHYFTGTAGQQLFFDAVKGNYSSANITIYDPIGDVFFTSLYYYDDYGFSNSNLTLTRDGDYRIVIDGNGETIGDYSFRLLEKSQATEIPFNSITPGSFGATGRESRLYRFTATAGQSLLLATTATNGTSERWRLYAPSGEQITEGELNKNYEWTLSTSGEYLLAFQGSGNINSGFQFQIAQIQRQTSELKFGVVVSEAISAVGQQKLYTFSGQPGQKIFLDALSGSSLRYQLYTPSGVLVYDKAIGDDSGVTTLTEAGTYQLVVEGSGTTIGNYSFAVTDLSGLAPLPFGTSVTGTINSTQQVQFYRIEGKNGQILNFDASANRWDNGSWILYGSTGEILKQFYSSSDTPDFRITLPSSGDYTLALFRSGTNPFNYSFTVTDLTPTSVTVSGLDTLVGETTFSSRQGSISANQVVEQFFTASSGTRVYFDSKNATHTNVRVQVLNPDGSTVFSTLASTEVGPILLEQTGLYKIRIQGVTPSSTGNYHFSLMEVQTKPATIQDNVRRLTLNAEITKPLDPGYTTDILSFEGKVGQRLLFDGILPDGASFLYGNVIAKLIGPSGQTVFDLQASSSSTGAARDFGPFTLTEAGTYNLMIVGQQSAKVDYRFKMHDLSAAQELQTNRVYANNLLRGTDTTLYKISGKAGQRLYFDSIQGRSSDFWTLHRPGDAKEVFSYPYSLSSDFSYVLPTDGEYILSIRGNSTTPGTYRFAVSTIQDAPAILTPGTGESGGTAEEGLGTYSVQIKVSDGKGGSDIQPFQVKVHQNPGNATPTIVSEAITKTFVNRSYTYDVDAIDADGEVLSYSLAEAPQGMFIDNETGVITWNSPIAGTHRVKIRVMDTNGGIDYQVFDLIASSAANGQVVGNVYNDLDRDGNRKLTNPNNLTPYTGITPGEQFANIYTAYDLGVPAGLPYEIAGMTFYRDATGKIDPNTMLVAAAAHSCGGVIFKVKVKRGDGGHIIGFDDDNDPSTPYVGEFFSYAPYISSGLGYGPDNKLFYSTAKGPYSGLGFVPVDIPGAGQLKATSQGSGQGFFNLNYANGSFSNPIQTSLLPSYSSAFVYLPVTAPGFDTGASILVGNSDGDGFIAYQVDSQGNPILATATPFLSDIDNPLGAVVDPITGDILLSSAGRESKDDRGNDRNAILAVRGLGRPVGNEPGLGEWLVYVDRNQNGQRDVSEEFAYTDAQGRYSFNLEVGTYQIRQELQRGWTQTEPLNPIYHQATVIANEIRSGFDFGNYGAPADAPNEAPVLSSDAILTALTEQRYLYRAKASDINGDELTFDLAVKPEGMAIAPNGTVSWVPGADQVGEHSVILRVSDGKGGVTLQSFIVKVEQGNRAPVITSRIPEYQPQVGKAYRYQVGAIDLDQDNLTYSLMQNPSSQSVTPTGVSIDARTGLLTWTPNANQVGGAYIWGPERDLVQPWQVTVKVSDGKSGETYQQLSWTVDPAQVNRAPSITSKPRSSVQVGSDYLYEIKGTDPDGDRLIYQLVTGPQGMTLQDGVVRWNPTAAQTGTHNVVVRVSDGVLTSQQAWTIQASNFVVNHAPIITSAPTQLVANVEKPYSYNLVATDADNDVLLWSLERSPKGMIIDPQSGALRWQPTEDQIGIHKVSVRVLDRFGASSTQIFELQVTGINAPPQIVSTPPTIAGVGQTYSYQAIATDPENQPINFVLGRAPAGAVLHPQTGVLTWTPQAGQLGSQTVEIQAIDDEGAITTQTFTIQVQAEIVNRAPSITSQPTFVADSSAPYTYQVKATDQDAGDQLTYQLLAGPSGVQIDAQTGLLSWATPEVGTYKIVVGAVDRLGLGAAQGFTLTVRTNQAPVIESIAPTEATLGKTYRYDVIARDQDGDALKYALDDASIAKGIKIDNLGRIVWNPTTAQSGQHLVRLTVTDAQGAIDEDTFTITVQADIEKPKVNLVATQTLANVGETVTFRATATDNVSVAGLTLLINGKAVILDAQGFASVKLDQTGNITALATAIDQAGNTGSSALLNVEVFDPTAIFNPVFKLDLSGIPDGVVTAPTEIKGSVGGDGFSRYELAIAPINSDNFRVIASGTNAVNNGTLGTVDPSLLQNDAYTLRLLVYGTNGSVTYLEETVNVAGELKLGNFRLSFTDLAIPVTGIPISLTRTYDTLTSNQSDDFGYGWRMEFRDTDLRTSLRKPTEEEALLDRYPAFDDRTKVFITLPGGKRETFSFKAKQVTQIDGMPLGQFASYFYEPTFVSEKGSTSKLSIEFNNYIRTDANGRYIGQQGQPFNPADRLFGGVYVLTTKDGTQYRIDAKTGDLLTVKDTNGNTLTYTDDAIVSSTGQKVTFERDAAGRIVSVKDPTQEYIRYEYDANGDLVSVTDREKNVTRMVYDTSYDDPNYANDATTIDPTRTKRSHFLREIIDPLGRVGARSEYDENGRLKQIVDANGKAVEMSYDLNNDRQVVRDQLGNETVYVYDDRGNVLTEIDAEGKITQRKYDENNWVTEETIVSDRSDDNFNDDVVIGFTTRYEYDAKGNKLSEETGIVTRRDRQGNLISETSLGLKTYSTYGDKGRLLSETDALGRTMLNRYDARGNLTQAEDALKQTSSYIYESNGLLKGLTDANDKATSFSYDARGNVNQVKDALGFTTDYTYNDRGDKLTEMRYRKKADGTIETLLTTWTYDSEGRVKTMTDAEQNRTVYGYDNLGRQIWVLDARGYVTESKYNTKGELEANLSSDGTVYRYDAATDALVVVQAGTGTRRQVTYNYDDAGRKISETDALNRTTRYLYDKVGRLIEVILPDATPNNWDDNPRTKTEYYSDGLVKAQIDERGNRTEFRYDSAGRQVEIIYADLTPNDLSDNPRTKYEYDRAGQQSAVIDALNRRTEYQYDDLGRLKKTIFADKTFVETEYDKLGRRIASIDPNGKRTEYEYDALGRLIGVKNALNDWTHYDYNESGNLISVTDAEQRITRYEYDKLGRRTATILPLNQRSTMLYDAVGNTKSITDFNGRTITYDYDYSNWLTQKNFQDGSKVAYTYTLNGQRDAIAFKNANGATTELYNWNYDERDRLIKRTDTIGMGSNQTTREIEYGYDVAGNKTWTKTASGTTAYTYDERNRLDTVLQDGVLQADYTYDAINNLISTKFGNGTEEVREYDVLNRLKSLENRKLTAAGTVESVISRFDYTSDKVGNRTTVTELSGRSMTYTYDDLYRLTKEVIDETGTIDDRTIEYSYDRVGNRLWKKETLDSATTQTDYQYDRNDRLEWEKVNGNTTVSYTYDAHGSTLTKTENGTKTSYVWNDDKRLIAATIEDANGVVQQLQYRYNDDGIRVASIVNGQETRFLLDEVQPYAQVLEEYAPNGTVAVSYVYGNDLISQTQGGQTTYYHVDGLGSTTELTDTTGNVVSRSRYDAFGNGVRNEGAIANKYLFTGEQFDSTLGDYYLRDRFYDSSTGRFTRRDTYAGRLYEPLTLHKYIYGNASPVNLVDPTGFSSQDPEELSRSQIGTLVEVAIASQYTIDPDFIGDNIYTGTNTAIGCGVGKNRLLCPDILNYDQKHYMEVKPFTPRGQREASRKMGIYKASLQPEYMPNTTWKAIPNIGSVIIVNGSLTAIYYNDNGVLYYTTRNNLADAIIALGALTAAARKQLKKWREGGEPETSLSPGFQPSLSSTTSYIQQANVSLIAAIAAASIVARYGWI
ncbi:YD repeat protein (plasmid) [Leptolyngbya boryana NIES-2135]|jgi:RHS repeat-associated protein|uniref:YD repeat protein n=1 Tax=Leptolyngbya boryana NIES-2135 TaxID=1973484 RepID=A0A1Z4JSP8_LEPBY|nr:MULTISPECIES: putative Ig domain-containing protein [Leptolyngbya]BAY59744.1 YD repeat protein [Leptolyngbya boryana NIES-2135]MBD2370603.1 putative Ig domain-containing protein [Leptolyngbya sp. FACHB-161]MBD2401381.1 putative Ig domain-containing protein [Leptolyngbya sp. FACHB-239]MBD2407932.1 putative Ig domain-containing protein [Leptolyngbya sp. FACHB-402]ULP33565.1 Ig-like domain-containing protein [Leptolyngbya boryana IU 594]